MTETNELRSLKFLAKRYARANRVPLHQALDLIAGELGFLNWVKLISGSKKGWQIDATQMSGVEALATRVENNAGSRTIDGMPKLDLNEDKIALLVRSALLDDATNVSEQLGALRAEISVDDEDGLWIDLEVDLWPEDKDPVRALAVAELLGLEVEVSATWSTIPFAWPGLGELTSSTSEYARMMLDAYAQYGGLPPRKRPVS